MKEMRKNPLISVIVPVYNDAGYLTRCLNSILGQTYERMEILLIDDGSTDGSGKICDEYVLRDRRVKSVHKVNEGTVSARRQGLEMAQGQLVSFIDGDDWIDRNMYEEMLDFWENAEYPDIVSSGLFFEYPELGVQEEVQDGADKKLYGRQEIVEELVHGLIYSPPDCGGKILTSVCSKIIRLETAKAAMEYMSDSLSIGEDGAYVCFLLGCCRALFVTHRSYYHYEQHENSQNTNYKIETMYKLVQLEKVMLEGINELIQDDQVRFQVKCYILRYLEKIINENFELDFKPFIYLFPYYRCSKGETVLIYGAGRVGSSYMRCLEASGFTDKILWTDKNYKRCWEQRKKVLPLDEALSKKYDHIVIALNDQKTADSVMKYMENYGVDKDKMIWEKPVKVYLFD